MLLLLLIVINCYASFESSLGEFSYWSTSPTHIQGHLPLLEDIFYLFLNKSGSFSCLETDKTPISSSSDKPCNQGSCVCDPDRPNTATETPSLCAVLLLYL